MKKRPSADSLDDTIFNNILLFIINFNKSRFTHVTGEMMRQSYIECRSFLLLLICRIFDVTCHTLLRGSMNQTTISEALSHSRVFFCIRNWVFCHFSSSSSSMLLESLACLEGIARKKFYISSLFLSRDFIIRLLMNMCVIFDIIVCLCKQEWILYFLQSLAKRKLIKFCMTSQLIFFLF